MKKRKNVNVSKWIITTLVIVLSLLTVSCNKESSSGTRTVKVGVLLGFSGTGSQNAIETKAALDLGLQDVNSFIQTGGFDASVELFYEDTKSDTTDAKEKAQILIDKGVQLIIGPYTSAEAKAVKTIVNQNDVLLVSHSAVSTYLAIPDDNLLRFVPSDTYQAQAICSMFAADSIEAIIPVVRNDLWSSSLIEASRNKYTADGGVVLTQQLFEPGTTDFSAVAANVKAMISASTGEFGIGKVAVYLISYSDGTAFLEALSAVGMDESIKIYGASAFAQSAVLLANGNASSFAVASKLQCPVFGYDEAAASVYNPLLDRIETTTGTRAGIYALAAYDILWNTVFTALSLESDPGFDAFKSRFIQQASAFSGATGSTRLDINGDRMHVFYDFWAVKNENGEFSWKRSASYNTSNQALTRF
ncbi:MAG: ABC transporter substrate-binding protein [Bacteroidales bacterium]